jgi:hypothetical protein
MLTDSTPPAWQLMGFTCQSHIIGFLFDEADAELQHGTADACFVLLVCCREELSEVASAGAAAEQQAAAQAAAAALAESEAAARRVEETCEARRHV